MPTEIRMPRLVDTMTEGTVVSWRVREGEPVAAGDVIAEIEVNKTTVDLTAPEAGTLTRIVVPAGTPEVEVGALLAVLDQIGSPAAAVAKEPVSLSSGLAEPGNSHAEPPDRREPAPGPVRLDVDASPLARSTAVQAALDLASLRGSGPAGRILQADVLAAIGLHVAPAPVRRMRPVTPSTQELPQSITSYDEVPHSRIRQVIARRLSESKRTIPHFYLEVSCRIDALLELRSELQATSAGGIRLSLNDFAVRAAALALREVPEANASWTDAATRRYRSVRPGDRRRDRRRAGRADRPRRRPQGTPRDRGRAPRPCPPGP